MKKIILAIMALTFSALFMTGCQTNSQERIDKATVEQQQAQYAKGQPIPMYNWSLERDLLIKLYNLRNEKVSTHSVWRGDMSNIEGECTSMGFGMPYDTSLTNPLQHYSGRSTGEGSAVGQAEPNGVFASTNTSATWVMCIGDNGQIEPVYVEAKVTVYPYPVKIDWVKNRVTKAGKATAVISTQPVQPRTAQ
jgi:hypothetical protein